MKPEPGTTLRNAWGSYFEQVVPPGASATQVRGTRRAFYAGAQSLLGIIEAMPDPGEQPIEADILRMVALKAELDAFVADLAAGRG